MSNAGDLLFAVEGDKAVQEIEALDSGYLKFIPGGPQPGDKLPVGTLIGYLVPEAELDSFEISGAGSKA
jgi:pyruvate dehydrogenase E2 component (dihydrolipoamide acetyltransferase)